MNALEDEFHEAMLNLYRVAKEKCRYNATYFLQMVDASGGVATAHKLLRDQAIQYGFTKLWDCGRLDLTVEYLVLDQRFESLFSEAERAEARRRLLAYDFEPGHIQGLKVPAVLALPRDSGRRLPRAGATRYSTSAERRSMATIRTRVSRPSASVERRSLTGHKVHEP